MVQFYIADNTLNCKFGLNLIIFKDFIGFINENETEIALELYIFYIYLFSQNNIFFMQYHS